MYDCFTILKYYNFVLKYIQIFLYYITIYTTLQEVWAWWDIICDFEGSILSSPKLFLFD